MQRIQMQNTEYKNKRIQMKRVQIKEYKWLSVASGAPMLWAPLLQLPFKHSDILPVD